MDFLDDLLAGIFGMKTQPAAPAPMQPGGQTPNDIIMRALGSQMPADDSQRVTGGDLASAAGLGAPRVPGPRTPNLSHPGTMAAKPASAVATPGLDETVPEPDFIDRLQAFGEGHTGGGLLVGIANAFKKPDEAVKAKRQQLNQTNLTYKYLTKNGFDHDEAAMAIGNPKLLQEILTAKYKQPERQIKEVFDEATGRKRMGSIDPATGSYLPVGGVEAPDPAKEAAATGLPTFKDRAQTEEGLRKEIAGTTKDWSTIRDAHSKIKAVGAEPQSPAGDMALVFGIMKLYDPGSVVRESEYATAENAGAVPDKVWNLYNKVKEGYRLTPDQRADFLNQADVLAQSQAQHTKRVLEQYRGIGERLGVDTRNVVLDDPEEVGRIGQRSPAPAAATPAPVPAPALSGAPPAQGGPQPGAVMDGYRFKGGNPADPNSWERVP